MNTCYNPFSLEGKTILVTGASSGIGKACAVECAKLGARIILSGRNEDRLNDTFNQLDGTDHSIIIADVTNQEDLYRIVSEIPIVDGIVLCAGIVCVLPVQYSSPDKMKEIFKINFFGTVELMRVLYKNKKISKGGSIVLIDSIGGVYGYSPGNAIYGASKASLNSFSKFAAKEFANRKIRVNCVCPGMIETPLINLGTISNEQLEDDARKRYPLGRYGKPEEVAYGVVYLLSDASSWITGIDLVIAGGVVLQ